jgi:hypothetical protein
MAAHESQQWKRLRQAREKLATQFREHPDVSLIDVGTQGSPEDFPENAVLRIHVRASWVKTDPEHRTVFPTQVDGIPVIVMSGDYRLEPDEDASRQR